MICRSRRLRPSEALTNTVKHASATRVTVRLTREASTVEVAIEDDGAEGACITPGSGLAGLRDPNLAKALALMHRDPAREWTVDALAKDVGLSRTRLADRFRHFLGMSPIAYLTDWRMRIAAEALEKTDKSVVEVAMDVGYNSEAAFNRAFKRTYNAPPAQFRQSRKGGKVADLKEEPAMAM